MRRNRFGGCFDSCSELGCDSVGIDRFGFGRDLGHDNRFDSRYRLRRQRRTALHAIAKRPQDRGKVFAGRTGQRGHCLRHHEAATIERASGFFTRRGLAPRQRRTNEIGEPFQNIDANRALATLAIAQHAIGVAGERLVDRERGAAAARQMLRARQRRQVDIVLLLGPQQRRQ